MAICLCRDTCGPPYYIHEFTQILSKTLVFIFVLYIYFQLVFDIHRTKIAMMILQFKLQKGQTFSTKKMLTNSSRLYAREMYINKRANHVFSDYLFIDILRAQ